jgi:hypothetical protein
LAIDKDENYKWVKTIYIDDPISSLDDNNVIIVASYLAKLIKDSKGKKFIISTHHGLFYNVRDIFISSTFSLFPSFVISREKLQDSLGLLKNWQQQAIRFILMPLPKISFIGTSSPRDIFISSTFSLFPSFVISI